jgi:hypothetical protein
MRQRKPALDYEIGVAGALYYVLLNFIVSLSQGRTEVIILVIWFVS